MDPTQWLAVRWYSRRAFYALTSLKFPENHLPRNNCRRPRYGCRNPQASPLPPLDEA